MFRLNELFRCCIFGDDWHAHMSFLTNNEFNDQKPHTIGQMVRD